MIKGKMHKQLDKTTVQAGNVDPNLFFMDKPREARQSLCNREYISFWADEDPHAVCGRSPIQCYTQFMQSFRTAFADDIGAAIEEIVIGCGPCGELRSVFSGLPCLGLCHTGRLNLPEGLSKFSASQTQVFHSIAAENNTSSVWFSSKGGRPARISNRIFCF